MLRLIVDRTTLPAFASDGEIDWSWKNMTNYKRSGICCIIDRNQAIYQGTYL